VCVCVLRQCGVRRRIAHDVTINTDDESIVVRRIWPFIDCQRPPFACKQSVRLDFVFSCTTRRVRNGDRVSATGPKQSTHAYSPYTHRTDAAAEDIIRTSSAGFKSFRIYRERIHNNNDYTTTSKRVHSIRNTRRRGGTLDGAEAALYAFECGVYTQYNNLLNLLLFVYQYNNVRRIPKRKKKKKRA